MEAPAVVDIAPFLSHDPETPLTPELKQLAETMTNSFKETGILIVKDPRVDESASSRFLDICEQYFSGAGEKLYNGEKLAEVFPERGYQIGATPEFVEKARDHCHRYDSYDEENQPLSACPPEKDVKWRYFWRIGELPPEEQQSAYEFENLVPEGLEGWSDILNTWGSLMLQCLENVAQLVAEGLDLPRNTFKDMMQYAPHLLAPTGADLDRYGQGTVFAGFHYDLNFITIHGKSRYPGLRAWTRAGKVMNVAVPDGHLLLQAGKMFEYFTGGEIIAGFHEVMFTERTQTAVDKAREEGRILWRISSTLFGHIRSDVVLQPLEKFRTEETVAKYPEINTGDFVAEEIKAISLLADKTS